MAALISGNPNKHNFGYAEEVNRRIVGSQFNRNGFIMASLKK